MAGLFRVPDLQTGHVKSWQFGVRAFDGERAEWRRHALSMTPTGIQQQQ